LEQFIDDYPDKRLRAILVGIKGAGTRNENAQGTSFIKKREERVLFGNVG